MSTRTLAYQALLPIFQPSAPVGRPDLDAEAIRQRAGVEYRELSSRDILNRCANPGMPFEWTINPYRGCELACTYCYARYTHRFFDLDRWQDFEQRIFVKRDAARALRRQLKKRNLQGQSIAIGTATDPYQPAEHHYRVTRSLLEVFAEFEGLRLSITTKSPLIKRDLDLLTALDQKHVVQVHLTITSADPVLSRRIERHAPDPRARFRTLETLASEGIATSVFCMPLMPGINSEESQLRPLFEAARDSGATDVVGSPLFLNTATRPRFLPWLAEEFPNLSRRYRQLYAWRDRLKPEEKERVMTPFRKLRLEYGFPRTLPGRG